MTVAALYVDPAGPYMDRPGVDPWTEERDARRFDGDCPVITHSPCAPWGRYAVMLGIRAKDGGCTAHAVRTVRRNGGVFEHPEGSYAFEVYGMPVPPARGWSRPDAYGGRTIAVDQGAYGHRAKKRTWLYAVLPVYPRLVQDDTRADAVPVEHMGKLERRLTPEPFAALLVELARSCIGWRPKAPARQLTIGNLEAK